MKILRIFAALALTVAVVAACMSCSKDKGKDEGPAPSYMKWDGKEYPIAMAQNWFNTTTLRDIFFFRTSTAAFSTNPDQVRLYVNIPSSWTNSYKQWTTVTSSQYKISIEAYDLEILMTDTETAKLPVNQRPKINGGQIAVTGGTGGYEISITMPVSYYDKDLEAMTLGYLELHYNGVTTFNEDLATYLDEDKVADPGGEL